MSLTRKVKFVMADTRPETARFGSRVDRNVPGTRRTPFSTVEEAHADLIERLAVLRPSGILYIADAQDLKERAQHLQQILGAVLDYVGAIVADMNHVAPGGSIDRKYLLGLISNAADDLVAGRVR
jgi:hypothetical protein